MREIRMRKEKKERKKVNPLEERTMTSRKRKGNVHHQRSGSVNPPAWSMIWIKLPSYKLAQNLHLAD
jgi:hypothetical protein